MSRLHLEVFDGDTQVGRVGFEPQEERFSFEYSSPWAARADSYSLSPHLLPVGQPAPSGTVRRYLENLLPEGRALEALLGTYQLTRKNLYGLVRQIGQETSGALAFLPQGQTPSQVATTRREIPPEELRERINDRASLPFSVWDRQVRLSIAGLQDKLAVYLGEEDRLFLVEGELASTHILKPEPVDGRLPMMVANEHFCMSLARALDINVAPARVLRLPEPVLLVERFDRLCVNAGVRRLHVIDACQGLDLSVGYKYERNFGSGRDVRHIRDGVSFGRLFGLADYTARKAATRQQLLRWAILQYLIGNADAHGKNVSFFCRPSGLELAPAYDLASVVVYPGVDHELAMAFGDEFEIKAVTPYDWAVFAQHAQIPVSVLSREMLRMGRRGADAAAALGASVVYTEAERGFLRGIADFIAAQARTLVQAAGAVKQVEID